VFDSPCSDNAQRDDEDSVGAEEFSALRHPGYEWVDPRVKLPLSRFSKFVAIVDFRKKYDILADTVDDRIVSIERAKSGDIVCHGREGHSHDFFYMYSTLISNFHVCLPFDDFTIGVLRLLNVAPSQLHPNSWASLQAFRLICRVFHLRPSPQVFLVVSSGSKHQCLLASYTQSFKRFKTSFFKVVIRSIRAGYFSFENGEPKFPFYWTKCKTREI